VKALYIGILTPGTTSRMRADTLAELLPGAEWAHVDTDEDFRRVARPLRSLAFRLKTGPLVAAVNRRVAEAVAGREFDLAWVDKGVYLYPATIAGLRGRCAKLVHFTPDTAFHANRSRHFFHGACHYDLLLTTKSFELEQYHELVEPGRVLLTTQAYDASLHRPPLAGADRRAAACFIGRCEPDREVCMRTLRAAGVPVRLGGPGWGRFVPQQTGDPGLTYLGPAVFGAEYATEYAAAAVGLGLLSKRFPELHTTRTFEIPACGALLATERTADTTRFFNEDEALFFNDYDDLAQRLAAMLGRPAEIEAIAGRGHRRVLADGRDYASGLSGVLERLSIH
jgi:hypothetical protein